MPLRGAYSIPIALGILVAGAGLAAGCGGGSSSTASAAQITSSAASAPTSAAAAVQPCKLVTAEDLTPLLGGQIQPGNPLSPDICGIVTSGGAIAGGGVLVSNQGAPASPGDKVDDPTVGADGTASVQVVKGKNQIKVQIGAGGAATAAQKTDWLKQLGQTVSSRLP